MIQHDDDIALFDMVGQDDPGGSFETMFAQFNLMKGWYCPFSLCLNQQRFIHRIYFLKLFRWFFWVVLAN